MSRRAAVIAERGWQDQPRAIEIDHALHGLGAGRPSLGNILLLDDLDARHQFERFGGDGVRLVPAEIVASPDIDDADRQVGGGQGAPRGRVEGEARSAPGGCLKERAARNFRSLHFWRPHLLENDDAHAPFPGSRFAKTVPRGSRRPPCALAPLLLAPRLKDGLRRLAFPPAAGAPSGVAGLPGSCIRRPQRGIHDRSAPPQGA